MTLAQLDGIQIGAIEQMSPRTVRLALLPLCPVLDHVLRVLLPRSVGEVLQPIVAGIPVEMTHLAPLRKTVKGESHQIVNPSLTSMPQLDGWIPLAREVLR
jgi:hypothetical protein